MTLPVMWQRVRTVILVVFLTMMLNGCAPSVETRVIRPQLPPPPGWAKAVMIAEPQAGEDALVVAARERGGRVQANRVTTNMVDWYQKLRAEYAKEAE